MFLKGMFDSEGHVGFKYENNKIVGGKINLCNTDKELIELCCLFLDKLNIEYSIHIDNREFRKKKLYIINIKSNSFEEFKNKIGSSIKRKIVRIEKLFKLKRKNRLNKNEINYILQLYKEGKTINEISNIVNKHPNTIRYHI